ncbi:MAG: hypothetical protein R2771_03475 [Saprospiraceae bacterium]
MKYLISYYKLFKQRTESEIKYWSVTTPYYEDKTVTWSDLESEFYNGLELSYNYRNFSISPGFEYSFSKTTFKPSENMGNKYRCYLIFQYSIK